jgi:hypothetical protein
MALVLVRMDDMSCSFAIWPALLRNRVAPQQMLWPTELLSDAPDDLSGAPPPHGVQVE